MDNPTVITSVPQALAVIENARPVLATITQEFLDDPGKNKAASSCNLHRVTYELRRAMRALDGKWSVDVTADDRVIAALELGQELLAAMSTPSADTDSEPKLADIIQLGTSIEALGIATRMLDHKPSPARPKTPAPEAWKRLARPASSTWEAIHKGHERQLAVIKTAVARHYQLKIKSLFKTPGETKPSKREARLVAVHLSFLWTHASPSRLEKHFGGDLGRAIHVARIISDKVWKQREMKTAYDAEILTIQNKMFSIAEVRFLGRRSSRTGT